MKYIRKDFTLPEDLVERLSKERSMSGTVAEALNLYFNHKDTVKRLVVVADGLEKKLNPEVSLGQLNNTKDRYEKLPERQSDEEPPHGFVDPTNRKRKWDGYSKEWVPVT